MTHDQIQLLALWQQAKNEADAVKVIIAKEMELRKMVVASLYSDPKEGTNNMDLAEGWKLKYVHKLDYKLDEAALAAVRQKLAEQNLSMDRVVKYTPSLLVKEYKALDDNIRSIVNEALTIKPSSPVLELVPPKGA